MLVQLTGLSKSYGDLTAVYPIDLGIEKGDFLAILGPSGCGKTTLLRMLGGLETPNTGRIEIEGKDVTRLGPEKRSTNMVFQGYGLFPHMSVRQNVAYGLRVRDTPDAELTLRVDEILALVQLTAFADRQPGSLSGGQQQRVALARALVVRPTVLLLDEPLAALDLRLRKDMQAELRRIHRSLGGTFVFVTHDQEEALSLANRVVVMEAGRIVQQGKPEDVYRNPGSRFAATFIGEANLIPVNRQAEKISLPDGSVIDNAGRDGDTQLVLRPEAIFPVDAGKGRFSGTVRDVIYLGHQVRVLVTIETEQEIAVHIPVSGGQQLPTISEQISLDWNNSEMRFLDD